MKKTIAALAAAFILATTGVTFAQDAHGNNPAMSPKHRLERQHHRIKQGVKNGSITPQEHHQLAKEGRHINHQRKRDLKKDDGHLTNGQRQQLEGEEDQRSNQIYQDKH
jgi:hypothetical protein